MKGEFLGLKKNNPSGLHLLNLNQKGQFAIEAVLLMTVLVGFFLAVTNQLKSKNVVGNFVSKPMTRVGNMAGYGTWQSECVGQGKSKKQTLGKCHPNSIHRSLSSNPK
ncbi:MAG: hypothetical protein H7256_10345 [Bdellovibrio sp.]|nr:hypothetical protein [Bdellovibrio sp.]